MKRLVVVMVAIVLGAIALGLALVRRITREPGPAAAPPAAAAPAEPPRAGG
jgi:hypothetical protein